MTLNPIAGEGLNPPPGIKSRFSILRVPFFLEKKEKRTRKIENLDLISGGFNPSPATGFNPEGGLIPRGGGYVYVCFVLCGFFPPPPQFRAFPILQIREGPSPKVL